MGRLQDLAILASFAVGVAIIVPSILLKIVKN